MADGHAVDAAVADGGADLRRLGRPQRSLRDDERRSELGCDERSAVECRRLQRRLRGCGRRLPDVELEQQQLLRRRGGALMRGAAMLSVGTVASGVLAYAFNALAARTLGPEQY